jgi:hypothetical protein
MGKEIKFKKSGLNFEFRNLELNKYGDLEMEYKIIGCENKDNDGYFYGAKYNEDKKAIVFSEIKVNGIKYKGVILPDKERVIIGNLLEELRNEYEKKVNSTIEQLLSGEKKISFKIVGCDFPHYQPWVDDIEGLDAQELMEKAVKKVLPGEFTYNICDYLAKKLKCSIGKKDIRAINLKYSEKSQEYYGLKSDIVTGFEMNLMDILQPVIDHNAKEQSKEQSIFDKARNTGEKQILKRWSEECNDKNEDCCIDNVTLYAMPDGSTKTIRNHTW